MDKDNRYEWISTRKGTPGKWGKFSQPTLWAVFSVDGAKGDGGDPGEDAAYFLQSTVEEYVQVSGKAISAAAATAFSPNPVTVDLVHVDGDGETTVTVRGAIAAGGGVTFTLTGPNASDFEIV